MGDRWGNGTGCSYMDYGTFVEVWHDGDGPAPADQDRGEIQLGIFNGNGEGDGRFSNEMLENYGSGSNR